MSAAVQLVGPTYIGILLNVALGGINWMQLLDYFRRPVQDRLLCRIVVLTVFLFGIVHTAVTCHIVWFYTIQHYGDFNQLARCVWTFGVAPLFTALIAAIVQAHYAWRIYLVGKKSVWIPGVILLLTVLQFVLAVYMCALTLAATTWADILGRLDAVVAAWFFSMATCDILITGALTYHLHRVKAEFDTTKNLIDRIVRLVVANNALTTASAVVTGILSVTVKVTGWHTIFAIMLSRLYIMSLLSSLNSRQSLREPPPGRGSSSLTVPPKPLLLTPRVPSSPDLAPLPTETTSDAAYLFVRPKLGRTASRMSQTSNCSWRDKEKHKEDPQCSEAGLGIDSYPASIRCDSDPQPSQPGLLAGDSWDPARFSVTASPTVSQQGAGPSPGDVVIDMPDLPTIDVVMTDNKRAA